MLRIFSRRHGIPLRSGNEAALLEGGHRFLEACRQGIRGARAHLRLEMYIWADDAVGREMAALLKEAMARGVKVVGLVDGMGSLGLGSLLQDLQAAGAQLRWFHPLRFDRPPWLMNRRNHRKLLVVDGVEAYLGSANWGLDYAPDQNPEAFVDLALALRGPVVEDLVADFEEVWRRAVGPAPALPPAPGPACFEGPWLQDVQVQALSNVRSRRVFRRHLALLLSRAGSRVQVANAYFVPGPLLIRLLRRLARRGVAVEILVPGRTDSALVQAAGRYAYGRLLSAGVKVWERQGRMLHIKALAVDGVWIQVGSTNLDPRSYDLNLELQVMIRHPVLSERVARLMEQQMAESVAVDPVAWERRSWRQRIQEAFAYRISWLL
ncbi:MAG TPA: phosphatidylserine/phosphatidylglycerophosphate/cardiolipin synthase family protein [Holophagaceae bacterium]|nr:phosphatidylserine/phosphatidylglycerophosphate/cardiolipin synthase family protein [Holophagaceae bacterium]